VAAFFKSTRVYGLAAALALSCAGVLLAAHGAGAQQGGSVDVYQQPWITGDPQVGATLTANGGAYRGPSGTQAEWQWWRCPQQGSPSGCREVASGSSATYTLTNDDYQRYIYLIRRAWNGNSSDSSISQPSSRIGPAPQAAPAPAPQPPAPTPTPTPTPTPQPSFDVAQPVQAPITNGGAILNPTRRKAKPFRPFPVIRMRGRLTATGAQISLLTVRAPKGVRIVAKCAGAGCPMHRWSRAKVRHRLTHVAPLERTLRSGLRITIVISRRGYLSKRTTFTIRRGKAPLRADTCLAAGRAVACPVKR